MMTAICKRYKAIAVAAVAAAAAQGPRRDTVGSAARTGIPKAKKTSAKAKMTQTACMRNYPLTPWPI